MEETDRPPRRSFFIGRWQPLHEGHIALVRRALSEGREAVIAIMDTPPSPRNPFTVGQRRTMIEQAFETEIRQRRLSVVVIPWIDEVCYGRACGWRTRHIDLPDAVKSITGSAMRRKQRL